MIIDDYISVLDNIDDVVEHITALNAELTRIELNKRQLTLNRNQLLSEKDSELRKERDRVISEAIQSESKPYKDLIANLESELEAKRFEVSGKRSDIESQNYNLIYESEFTIINDCLSLVKRTRKRVNDLFDYSVAERIKGSVTQQHSTIEGVMQLRDLVDEKLQAVSLKRDKSWFERALEKVFPTPDQVVEHPASLQILKFIVTVLVVSFFLFRVPAVLVAIYSAFIGVGVYRDINNTRNLLEVYYPYKYLEYHCIKLRDMLENDAANQKATDLQNLTDELSKFESDVETRIEDLHERISEVPDQVRRSLNEGELQKRVEALYADKLNTIQTNIGKQDLKMSRRSNELTVKQVELEDLKAEKTKLKDELVKAVETLESLGTSKLLLKTFFLGFSDDDRLITMDYNGETTFVMYSGTDSNCVTPFIRMMLIQFFTNMLINNLFIDIIDTDNSGVAFDIFRYEDLKDIISVASTSEEATDLISELHKEMRQRSEKISMISDDIDHFNEIMIQRDSFTLEYRIVIFNTCNPDILKNVKFLQICKNGPVTGIIPIIFYNVLEVPDLSDLSQKDKDDKSKPVYKIWSDFFKSVSQFYNFNSDTSEVSYLGPDFKQSYLERLAMFM